MPFYTTKKEERKENNKHGSPEIFRGKNFLILQKIYTFVP